jgi:predicted transcriptional regulator
MPGKESAAIRRDKLRILVEILSVAQKGASKTQIMYRANMSFTGVNEYLSLLTRAQLLIETRVGKRVLYKPTEKGLAALALYSQLNSLFDASCLGEAAKTSSPLVLLARPHVPA